MSSLLSPYMGSTWHELAIVLYLSFEDNVLHNLDTWLALCKLSDVQVFDSFCLVGEEAGQGDVGSIRSRHVLPL